MSDVMILLSILGALAIGAVSPGPSFVLVSRISMTSSRLGGLAAAVGTGLGGVFLSSLAVAGLSALLMQVDWLYLGLKVLGGAYLVYLGIRIWRGASEPIVIPEANGEAGKSLFRPFSIALVTQISNPKTAIVYGSVFAALLPASPPTWMLIAIPPLIFVVETTWYAVVALAFSARGPRSVYLGSKSWIDRAAGVVLGALGSRLIVESATP